jgi:hypothetical protein
MTSINPLIAFSVVILHRNGKQSLIGEEKADWSFRSEGEILNNDRSKPFDRFLSTCNPYNDKQSLIGEEKADWSFRSEGEILNNS